MKIPLRVIRKKGKKKPDKEYVFCVLSAYLSCRKPQFRYKEIEFMIDSGSTNFCTMVTKDAKILGIPFNSASVKKVAEKDAPIA